MLGAKRKVELNLKNIPGWRTNRKIVVFSVDDYGNIRTASKKALENLRNAGLNIEHNRFDLYDSLETRADLTQLFEVLTSVQDKNGRHAVFTAFALSANPDFEAIKKSGYDKYRYELLPDTLNRLPGYEGTWQMWQEGIEKKILVPQFHGREHLNVRFFNELAWQKNKELLACIDNASFSGISYNPYRHINYATAFALEKSEEAEAHKSIITDGLNAFEKVFGFRAANFIPPGNEYHHSLEPTLSAGGIRYIDVNLLQKEHLGNDKYTTRLHYLGQRNKSGQLYLIRNCVFEPTMNKSVDYVDRCLAEMEVAFKWNKPANISTHRVNFSGHIDPKIREYGLQELKSLIGRIVKRWPDVEFMASNELGDLIALDKRK